MNRIVWLGLGFLCAMGLALPAQALDGDRFEFRLHGALLGDVTFFNTTPRLQAVTQSEPGTQTNLDQTDHLWVSGQTRGMVHWFKNYAATFRSEARPNGVKSYRVTAVDADVPEVRHIEFPRTSGSTPFVIDFSDRTHPLPLKIDPTLDRDRIDPLSVLQNLLHQLDRAQTCDAVYRVYDGKRRYTVLTQERSTAPTMRDKNIDAAERAMPETVPRLIQCQVTLQTQSKHQAGERAAQPAGFWPFKKQEQTMTIEFKRHPEGYRFSSFDINSPLGTIKGRPAP